MMSVYAVNGSANEVSDFISKNLDFQSINTHILVTALTAYSHAGNTDQSLQLFDKIENNPRVARDIVDIQVYTALIDGFSRKGMFDLALTMIERAKSRGLTPDAVLWMTVLSPCRHFKNLDIALQAFTAVQELGDKETRASAHVLLADVYKSCGDNVNSDRIHRERLNTNLTKVRGAVTLEIGAESFVFHVGQVPQELENERPDILKKLDEWSVLLASQGVNTDSVKCLHSEKLALAFAVLRNQKHVTMRKNLSNLFSMPRCID